MELLREIKLNRIVFAVIATVLVADTIPHPNLQPGLLASSWSYLQAEIASLKAEPMMLADTQSSP